MGTPSASVPAGSSHFHSSTPGGTAVSDFINDQQRQSFIDALLEELSYAERNKEADAVKQIKVELAACGHKAKPEAKKAEKRPAAKPESETR